VWLYTRIAATVVAATHDVRGRWRCDM
jgi:hypothetical protein